MEVDAPNTSRFKALHHHVDAFVWGFPIYFQNEWAFRRRDGDVFDCLVKLFRRNHG